MTDKNRLAEIMRHPHLWLLFVSSLGATLRIHDLPLRSLWFDEAALFHIASNPLDKVVAANAIGNSAPPLYALLVKMVMAVGSSEAMLRSVSCLAGIIAVPLIFFLARRFVSPFLALFSSLLVALSPQQIFYSTQLREYSLAFALAIWLMLAAHQFLETTSLRRAISLGMVFALSISTQYGLGLLNVALDIVCAVCLLSSGQKKGRAMIHLGLAQIPAALAIFGVYLLGLREQFSGGGFGASYLAHGYGDGTWQGFLNLLANTKEIISFAFPSLLLSLLCAIGLVDALFHRSVKNWCGIGFLLVPFFLIIGAATLKLYPYLGERQGIFLTPMLYVFAAIGLAVFHKLSPRLHAFQFLVALATVIIGFTARSQTSDLPGTSIEHLRPVVETLIGSADATQDLIYVYSGAIPAFKYYLRRRELPWVAGVMNRDSMEPHFRQLDDLLSTNKRVWFVFSHTWQNEAEQIIQYVQARRQVYIAKEEKGAWLFVVAPKAP